MADAGLYVIEVDGPFLTKNNKFFSMCWNYIKSKTKESEIVNETAKSTGI
jgi:hypothetical protein